MNAMGYVRGSTEDYDNWASLVGDDGWSAESMQRYMRKHQVRHVIYEQDSLSLHTA